MLAEIMGYIRSLPSDLFLIVYIIVGMAYAAIALWLNTESFGWPWYFKHPAQMLVAAMFIFGFFLFIPVWIIGFIAVILVPGIGNWFIGQSKRTP